MTRDTTLQLIPGLPAEASTTLLHALARHPNVQQVWLYGSRAMGRERLGSDVDLCLEGPRLTHADLLQLMESIDELLLAWTVDLSLRHQLPAAMEAHVHRVGVPLLNLSQGQTSTEG